MVLKEIKGTGGCVFGECGELMWGYFGMPFGPLEAPFCAGVLLKEGGDAGYAERSRGVPSMACWMRPVAIKVLSDIGNRRKRSRVSREWE